MPNNCCICCSLYILVYYLKSDTTVLAILAVRVDIAILLGKSEVLIRIKSKLTMIALVRVAIPTVVE